MYKKGASAERELASFLLENGFCVMRAAGSGFGYSPDILAFKKGAQYAIEVKSQEKEYLSIPKDQGENMKRWEEITNITPYVAWRRKGRKWRIIPFNLFKKREKSWTLKWEDAEVVGEDLETFVRHF